MLITNDRNTMVGFARQRLAAGDIVTGLIVTTNEQSIGSAIEDVLLVAECLSEVEMWQQRWPSCHCEWAAVWRVGWPGSKEAASELGGWRFVLNYHPPLRPQENSARKLRKTAA